jgi:hypothetical protein
MTVLLVDQIFNFPDSGLIGPKFEGRQGLLVTAGGQGLFPYLLPIGRIRVSL